MEGAALLGAARRCSALLGAVLVARTIAGPNSGPAQEGDPRPLKPSQFLFLPGRRRGGDSRAYDRCVQGAGCSVQCEAIIAAAAWLPSTLQAVKEPRGRKKERKSALLSGSPCFFRLAFRSAVAFSACSRLLESWMGWFVGNGVGSTTIESELCQPCVLALALV